MLGFYLWAVLFDDALADLSGAGLTPAAYIDDVAVIIQADTKAQIEQKGAIAEALPESWCHRTKL